jgi:branched-chain amino acid transport system ATP-binding protein
MLRVEGLSRRFGGVHAVRDVSLSVAAGELRGIIGPNGAGKSTLFNLIAGHLSASAGRIFLRDEAIEGLPSHERARRGIAIVYQGARIFRGMSVLENVLVGAHRRGRSGVLHAALQSGRQRREEGELRALAEGLLAEVGLAGLGDRPAESLPLGQQRALQLARALAADPAVLLLDEPASGLRDVERAHLARLIRGLRERGLTILLVEHDVALVTSLSDRITVLALGSVIADGAPATIREDRAVIDAYLGSPVEHAPD